ncbi:hypothetical protein [Nocardioides sp. WS12]|uniref:hypothetical protein n=1 Tax=Nocardioides sp. WS12 TaxID=2486272 RepID=UPI0015FB024C|nr:hypothetical protein [Nocardioides sp. WS12]
MLQRLAPLLVATALLAGGCAGESTSDAEKILIESSSSPLGPTGGKGTAKDKPTASTKEKEPKRKRIVARQSGISFLAPVGAAGMTDGSVSFAADSPEGKEFAKRLGITVEQLRGFLATSDVYLSVFAGVISVGPWDQSGVFPTRESIESEIGDLGYTVDDVEDVQTPVGDGRIIAYTQSDSSGEARGVSLYLLNGSTVVDFGVIGADARAIRAVIDEILPTLKRA